MISITCQCGYSAPWDHFDVTRRQSALHRSPPVFCCPECKCGWTTERIDGTPGIKILREGNRVAADKGASPATDTEEKP